MEVTNMKIGVSISMELDLANRLEKQAKKEKEDKSAIVCRALETELNIEG